MDFSIFHRDDVTFLEVLEFIIKLLLLFDTSSLFSTPEKLNFEVEDDDIYNQCFGTQKGGDGEKKAWFKIIRTCLKPSAPA